MLDCKRTGADRLLFGTDFPWVMGEGEAGYAAREHSIAKLNPRDSLFWFACAAFRSLFESLCFQNPSSSMVGCFRFAEWEIFDAWAAEHLDVAQTEALAGGTAAKLFGFDTATLAKL
jgi:hypothetical protein